ncbi:Histone-lysine N-methyltransferase SETDB1 [Orchesella cincta]|uniref:Histone-lysine N-methyltransferase SETDB1 n=1 Tax=Orchesella cincta TaxID=48709 RepID=A0A1D2M634_ORCCI|nr:Histone-lysine N-methyltransferase SETDB1 [Orchesella cincta]
MVQYVEACDVFRVFYQSNPVWLDVHEISRNFIENYISKYPVPSLVNLQLGSLVPVKKNGKWQIALVLEIDGIIARVRFENDMEITNVLRSSEMLATFINPVTKLNTIDPDILPEYQGSIRKVKVPLNTNVFSPHECNSGCVESYVPEPKLNRMSPLVIPLFFSWSRGVTKVGIFPQVIYGTPCGKAISSFKELIAYLITTESDFPQEYFSFNVDISVSDQFVPGRSLYKNDDASYGLEPIPIQVVNSIDKERLPEFEYIVESVLSQKLKYLKKNESDIQMCCKCVDNCKGKLNCACKKLNTNSKKQYSGYEDKRLEEYNPETVFECNSNCSCKQNCPTRVVQNGVLWPLQIFKSSKKGWGIRTLFDIPKGCYICSFAGEILCDDAFKRASRAHGSTYMACLSKVPTEKEELEASTKKKRWATFSLPMTPPKDCFTVDATIKGNVARFFNHSCDPNLFMQRVFHKTHDPRFPTLAFFTSPGQGGFRAHFQYVRCESVIPANRMISADMQ